VRVAEAALTLHPLAGAQVLDDTEPDLAQVRKRSGSISVLPAETDQQPSVAQQVFPGPKDFANHPSLRVLHASL